MHIKRLEIDNFKSFANKSEIPFLTGFTAIAGINGSGKSNIIDSILFTLGLSSARALRSEKGIADLISTHNKRNEAYVKVVFDLDDDNGTEISFARRVKKTSQGYQSIYYINDKPQTLAQVHNELEKYQITPNSNNIIMQGDVVGLVNCSSKERRQFIDEIAGTADFDRKIEMATNELNTVEERVQTSNFILGEITSRVEQLKEEREVAIKYRELKDKKDELESQITVVKYFDFKRILDMVHQNILEAQKNKKIKEKESVEIDEKIAHKKQEYDEICAKVKAQGEDKQLEVKRQAEEKKGEIQRKKDSIIHTDKVIFQNNKTIENSKNGIEDFNSKKQVSVDVIKEKEAQKKKFEDELELQKQKLNKILEEVTGLNKTADTYIEKRAELRRELDKIKDDETNIVKDKISNESRLEFLNNELNSANKNKENLLISQKTFKDDKDRLELLIEKLSKEMEDMKLLQKLTFESLDKTKNEINDVTFNIQLSNKKIMELEANKRAFKTFGLGAGVETIMQANLKGVHAPLLQLADVEAEYVDAINEALGGRARFVIVENEHVASQAIEILKSQGRDRATFLPLNKLKPAPNKLALPKDKGVIDFAINLMDFDDKYIDAFYFALGETLVVDNMETAKKLMGKYRIVTLDGEIFEKSGAITGGAKRKNQMSFGKMDDKELETFKSRLVEFEKTYQELLKRKDELESRLDKIRNDFSNASNSYNGAKIELNALVQTNLKSNEVLDNLNKKIAEVEPEIKALNSKLDKLEEKHVNILDKISKLTDEIKEVEKFIDEGELNKLKDLTKGAEDEIKQTEKNILNVENEILRDNQNIIFYEKMIEQKEIDINKLQQDNINLKADKEKFEAEIKLLEKDLAELEAQIIELGKNLIELQNLRQNIQDDLLKFQNNRNLIQNEIERITEQIESSKVRRNEIEPQFKETHEELKEKGVDINSIQPTEMSVDDITSKIQKLQKKMDELGLVNMRAIEAYDEVISKQNELKEKLDTLEKEKQEIQNRMTGYENLKKETFLNTFNAVNNHFMDIFANLTDGTGRLILENPDNPFLGGLTIEGQQKNKKNQKLAGMSGGEKTLMALSLVFAAQRYLPAPFYALDEVDAALDGFNVERIAKMISNQSKDTQFIVISQRSQMIESADRMIGVTQKDKGVTKISGVKLQKEPEKEAALAG